MSALNRKAVRSKIRRRIRKKIAGTSQRPRLAVHFSNKNVYAQVIDDESGKTLFSASTREKDSKVASLANRESASAVGKLIAERAKAAKIDTIIFDRGGYIYHGKVKALADAARENGLQF